MNFKKALLVLIINEQEKRVDDLKLEIKNLKLVNELQERTSHFDN
ncbi:2809_t:CDS:2 [Gigaspora rosea]|nr:2809_t:CDS:2 [Gigaspora rosea]